MCYENAANLKVKGYRGTSLISYSTKEALLIPCSSLASMIIVNREMDFICSAGLVHGLTKEVKSLYVNIYDLYHNHRLGFQEWVPYRDFFYTREKLAAWVHPHLFLAGTGIEIRVRNDSLETFEISFTLQGLHAYH